jgi:hypothetical protein
MLGREKNALKWSDQANFEAWSGFAGSAFL